MPPDAGDDSIVGTDRDKRIPRDKVIGRVPWRAQPLCQFRGDAEQRQCDTKNDQPAKEFLRRLDPHWSI